jgi:hypothetical protein
MENPPVKKTQLLQDVLTDGFFVLVQHVLTPINCRWGNPEEFLINIFTQALPIPLLTSIHGET